MNVEYKYMYTLKLFLEYCSWNSGVDEKWHNRDFHLTQHLVMKLTLSTITTITFNGTMPLQESKVWIKIVIEIKIYLA